MRYILPLIFLCILFGYQGSYAQYTETINSNNPGESQGGFAVGNNVLQFEGGLGYGKERHKLLDTRTAAYGLDYSIRYGLFFESLEINWIGSYVGQSVTQDMVDGSSSKLNQSGFRSNTVGLKYLVFDPWKRGKDEKPNLKSWRENHRWKWKYLIPAVSLYGGANFVFSSSPYRFEQEPPVSPNLALITQSDWKDRWVLVSNFVVDKITSDFPSYEFLITLIHTLKNPRWAVFGEYQGIKSDFYSDYLFRGGTAFMIHKDFQVEADLTFSPKTTPSQLLFTVGASYRMDWHKKDEIIRDKSEENLEDIENSRALELQELDREIQELNKEIEGLDNDEVEQESKLEPNRGFQSFEDPEDLEKLEQQKEENRSIYVDEYQSGVQAKQDKKDLKLSKKEAKKEAKLQKKSDKAAMRASRRSRDASEEGLEEIEINISNESENQDLQTPVETEAPPKRKKRKREKRRKLSEEEKERELDDLDRQIKELEEEFALESEKKRNKKKKKKKKSKKDKKDKKRTADLIPDSDAEKEGIKKEVEDELDGF